MNTNHNVSTHMCNTFLNSSETETDIRKAVLKLYNFTLLRLTHLCNYKPGTVVSVLERKSMQSLVLFGKHIHDAAYLRQDNKGEMMPMEHQQVGRNYLT